MRQLEPDASPELALVVKRANKMVARQLVVCRGAEMDACAARVVAASEDGTEAAASCGRVAIALPSDRNRLVGLCALGTGVEDADVFACVVVCAGALCRRVHLRCLSGWTMEARRMRRGEIIGSKTVNHLQSFQVMGYFSRIEES